jgi:DNA end-binding protein Ku
MSTDLGSHPDEPVVAASAATAPAPRGRPSWSGLLRLSLVSVPVKAYPAVSTSSVTPLHQLHADCGQRIRYEKRCPQHGPVDAAAIVRGYAYAPDQHVLVDPEELDRLRPNQEKVLLLEHFLPAHQVEPTRFAGRSLYLLPDSLAAQHPYGVVAEAMRQARRWALGRVVFSAQRCLVLVRPASRVLVLDVLHYPAQVRAPQVWDADLGGGLATAEELRLAGQLIDAASGPLDWSRYRDTTAEELAALVETKVAKRALPAAAEPSAVLQLLDALKQSVASATADSDSALAGPARSRQSRCSRRPQS